ncbi:MAG TPA: hypothetical protein VHG51_05005, partial [Longimicrobiaceae bacterium]|nr:hypothetical protein [Longimicrobiaceae bacterium]
SHEAAAPAGAPEQVAAAAVRRCGRRAAQARQACYDEALQGVLRAQGVRPAMEALNAVVARDRNVARDAHVYAHGIGIAAFAGAERVGETFATCTPEHQSGCYHGVVQAYFVDARRAGGELTTDVVNALCRDWRPGEGASGDRWLQFQCAHGMGHGLVMFEGHDLPKALRGCDLLRSDFERETCYQGAFMENIVNAIMPHHPAGTLAHGEHGAAAGHDAHGGHGAAPASAYRALDPDDLLYPCSTLAERYWSGCYSMQTSAMLHHTGGDVERVARECERVPERMRTTCFLSLGRDISGMTTQDRAGSREMCARVAGAADRAWCHVGVATNMLNVTARAADGLDYCRELPPGENKAHCYELVGGQLLVLAGSDPAREEACRAAEPEFVDACRRGARLTAATR